jgi:hypothetical protein|tara:strand:- start:341 stop:460 length:120 start_codon:yes stop_codon:yes gene_type:complete
MKINNSRSSWHPVEAQEQLVLELNQEQQHQLLRAETSKQ